MFGRNKQEQELRTDLIENTLGFILVRRGEIINVGDVLSENIYAAIVLAPFLEKKMDTVRDQFDILAIHLARNAFNKRGAKDAQIRESIENIMRDSLADGGFQSATDKKEYTEYFLKKLDQYRNCSDLKAVATEFLKFFSSNESQTKFDNAVKIFGKQLESYQKYIDKNIANEIKAS